MSFLASSANARPAKEPLDEELPFCMVWSALDCAETMPPEDRAEYRATAREMKLSVPAAIVSCLLAPVDQPDYALLFESPMRVNDTRVWLGEIQRDVDSAYVWLVRRSGTVLEHGPMVPTIEGWLYEVRRRNGVPRHITAIVMATGAPHVNA